MALAPRYNFTFLTVLDAEQFNITISQEGYGGSVEILSFMPGRNFLRLSYDKNNTNVMWPIRGSQMAVTLSLQPSQIEEFVLADNRTWFIEVTGAQGFEWYGWMQPQTSINYSPYGLSEIELQFSDNLGALQSTPAVISNANLIDFISIADIIDQQLSYTDIALPITIDTSLRHVDYPGMFAEDLVHLEQAMTLDYNGQEPQMSYEILSKVTRMLQCVVYQKAGTWVVENWIDKYLASYPTDILVDFKVANRAMNIRFESPLSKVTARSYHYQIRHTQQNRDFADYISSGPNKGFTFWEQFGLLTNEIFSSLIISGKRWLGVLGNFTGTSDSGDYYMNVGTTGAVTGGEAVRVFLNYEPTPGLGFDVNARVAILLEAGTDKYWLRADGVWFLSASPIILLGDTEINAIRNIQTIAPVSGNVTIQIYRPEVPSAGGTYFPTQNYIRFAYADILASKVSQPTDYKMFKSVGTDDNRGMRQNELFETMGLQYDTEFSPNGASFFQYEDFVSFVYDDAETRLDSKFITDYDNEERSLTQFATNTYMRVLGKSQIFIEADLYGKNLSVGDIYTIDVPGLPPALNFVVVSFDWDVKNDMYRATLAYIDYDATDNITQSRYWLQQNQDDPDNK